MNIDEIWPSDDALRNAYNEKNRTLDTTDINRNSENARIMRLKQKDSVQIREFLSNKEQKQSDMNLRPYKNASNVFVHLVDDPATRKRTSLNS